MDLSIKKLGNSAGLILPSKLLRTLNLTIGSAVTAEQVKGRLILTPVAKPRYSLADLIAQCDLKAKPPKDMQAWGAMRAVGKEIT